MIDDKNSLIEEAEYKLNYAKKIVDENSELFEECKKYHDLWIEGGEGRNARLFVADIFIGVNFDVMLGEEDSMDDFNMFLDEIPYDPISINEYIDGNWIRYQFNIGFGTLHVFCNYSKSKHCKLVETGETKPIYKRVCV